MDCIVPFVRPEYEDSNLIEKTLFKLTGEDFAYLHLSYSKSRHIVKDAILVSNLHDLYENLLCSFNNYRTEVFTPLMCGFAILDQIGTFYGRKSKKNDVSSGVKSALHSFTDLSSLDIKSLYSLRNSVFHDGSFVSKDRYCKHHALFVCKKNLGFLIKHPDEKWDGVFKENLSSHITMVDTLEFKSLVKQILESCMIYLAVGDLEVKVSNRYEYLFKSFKFTQSH
ncbi:hypothetical protein [Pseudomonas piscis]|uniref:Uncharacterized protein n=1 Tax=Pseudomonas piscis TaxID=2614538 RepID=A0A7X1PUW8_9PSED|nr:hypothetical protein [Pseudomonas piscis]MQA57640.1 hypothetical protein [Pseudomonas piscis]